MLKLLTLAALFFAQANSISCPAGSDLEAPYIVPKSIEQNCEYCELNAQGGIYSYTCIENWAYSLKLEENELINGQVCVTGEAILKNFMSEEAAIPQKKAMEAYAVSAKESGSPLTYKDILNIYGKARYYFCKNKDSCNSYTSIDEACKNFKLVWYDKAKSNGVFDSGSSKLIVSAQIATFSV